MPALRVAASPRSSPVSGLGVEFFNADDHAAQLNHGSYRGIPQSIRVRVNRLFESFVNDCIMRRASFALETTLRSSITFEQAATARREGFFIEMHYLALNNFAQHAERIKIRADKGGHSAPESVLRGIYDSSLRNLARAIREMDAIAVYDNSGQVVPCRACCCRPRAAMWFTLPRSVRNGWNRLWWNCNSMRREKHHEFSLDL